MQNNDVVAMVEEKIRELPKMQPWTKADRRDTSWMEEELVHPEPEDTDDDLALYSAGEYEYMPLSEMGMDAIGHEIRDWRGGVVGLVAAATQVNGKTVSLAITPEGGVYDFMETLSIIAHGYNHTRKDMEMMYSLAVGVEDRWPETEFNFDSEGIRVDLVLEISDPTK